MYKTGSIYGFDRVGLAGAGVTQKGTWNDYEIRVVDRTTRSTATVFSSTIRQHRRPGVLPAALGRPGTDGRRFASGYIGLQVHSTTDVISYRDIRIKEL